MARHVLRLTVPWLPVEIDLDTDLDLDEVREADLEREGELQYPDRVRECDNGYTPGHTSSLHWCTQKGECHWEHRY